MFYELQAGNHDVHLRTAEGVVLSGTLFIKSNTQSFAMLTLINPLRKFSLAHRASSAPALRYSVATLKPPACKLRLLPSAGRRNFFWKMFALVLRPFFPCLFLFLKQPAKTHLAIECKAAEPSGEFSEARRLCSQWNLECFDHPLKM